MTDFLSCQHSAKGEVQRKSAGGGGMTLGYFPKGGMPSEPAGGGNLIHFCISLTDSQFPINPSKFSLALDSSLILDSSDVVQQDSTVFIARTASLVR